MNEVMIVIDDVTERELLGDRFELEELGERALRGRTHLELMFRLHSAR